MIVNLLTFNSRPLKYIKQKWTELKREIQSSPVTVGLRFQ